MKNKKITKTSLARDLNITPQAISMWVRDGKIPAHSCIELEPILKINARKIFLNPNILFSVFNNTHNKTNNSIPKE